MTSGDLNIDLSEKKRPKQSSNKRRSSEHGLTFSEQQRPSHTDRLPSLVETGPNWIVDRERALSRPTQGPFTPTQKFRRMEEGPFRWTKGPFRLTQGPFRPCVSSRSPSQGKRPCQADKESPSLSGPDQALSGLRPTWGRFKPKEGPLLR